MIEKITSFRETPMQQQQFLELATAETAKEIFWAEIQPAPVGEETVALENALNRVLSRDVHAALNVPYFDRSNFDGFAVRAADTFGAEETAPISLSIHDETLACGVVPHQEVKPGTATLIATGGVIPRGADAVMMVEHTQPAADGSIQILRSVVPGEGISFAGSDIGADEIVLRKGDRLSSRETGTLAALGVDPVWVWKRPRVAVISTGDELIAPGTPMAVGKVFDTNGVVIAHALAEIGCEAVPFGIVPDDEARLIDTLHQAMDCDFIILSGGTSKGAGDLNYRAVQRIGRPGILVHGVALKPGKPLCLASLQGTPTAILPGFPTSALFTFTHFIVPMLQTMAGQPQAETVTVSATVPQKINATRGRTDFHLVSLVKGREGLSAYSMGSGSGSITTFARADGFIEIPRQTEIVEAGSRIIVTLTGRSIQAADLIIIGSHCVGVDLLVGEVRKQGYAVKFIPVGSMGGIRAISRGECDLAGSHLMDEKTGIYNAHLLNDSLTLVKGYRRNQGIVFRKGDHRFNDIHQDLDGTLAKIVADPSLRMINRNRGSGTRVLLDQILGDHQPPGFLSEAKTHNAVAAAIAQSRADWGLAIRSVAENLDLGFHPYQDEEYDFVVLNDSADKPSVRCFLTTLRRPDIRQALDRVGLREINGPCHGIHSEKSRSLGMSSRA
jgi:putative molybdopterin biosynthesis protein